MLACCAVSRVGCGDDAEKYKQQAASLHSALETLQGEIAAAHHSKRRVLIQKQRP